MKNFDNKKKLIRNLKERSTNSSKQPNSKKKNRRDFWFVRRCEAS